MNVKAYAGRVITEWLADCMAEVHRGALPRTPKLHAEYVAMPLGWFFDGAVSRRRPSLFC